MNGPKVSVIVPIYKVEKYLIQCLDSIVNQTLKDIEIILVDEGEWDACYAIMRLYASEDPRVKIIHKKCGGYGAACNLAIDAATGEYIGIVESDDFIEPTMYEEMYNKAKSLDADVLKTPFYYYYDKAGDVPERKEICDYKDFIGKSSPEGSFSIMDCPQQMAVHASVWAGIYKTAFMRQKNIRFVEARGASYVDVEFRIRTFIEADKIVWLDREFYNYRCTNLSSSTNTFNLSTMIKRWKEAHDYFEALPSVVYDKVGPYLFHDEYLNTFAFFCTKKITDEQYLQMRQNLLRIPDAVIMSSYKLTSTRKYQVLTMKRCDTMIVALKRTRIFRMVHLVAHCLYFNVVCRGTLFRVQLMSGVPQNIAHLQLCLFNKITLSLVLGKE